MSLRIRRSGEPYTRWRASRNTPCAMIGTASVIASQVASAAAKETTSTPDSGETMVRTPPGSRSRK